MPVNYSIPPWLEPQGGTPTESYAKGFLMGEQRRQANQRAALEQQQMQMRAAAESQAQAQRAAVAQAELAQEVKKQEEAAQVAKEELAIKKQVQGQRDREAAMIFAGAEGIRSGIAAGESPDQVLMKNAGFFFKSPGALGSSIKAMAPPPTPTVREFEGGKIPPAVQMGDRLQWPPGAGQPPGEELFSVKDVTDEQGNILGRGVVTGPRSGTFRESKKEGPDYIDRGILGVLTARMKKNAADLAESEKTLPALEKSPRMKAMTEQNIARLKESIKADEDQIQSMRKSVPAPAPKAAEKAIRIKRKSDGKTFTYRGNRKDVPESYEILE